MSPERPTLELSAPQIIGGALAAASAAVASSWLGVAGTVLGAVIVSLVASVGSALYAHSLERSSQAIRETLPVVPARTLRSKAADAGGSGPVTAVLPAVGNDSHAPATNVGATGATFGPRRTSISWRTVGVSALASLALAAAVLTGFESFVGKSASSLTGAGHDSGTTVSRLVSGEADPAPAQSDPPEVSVPQTPGSTAGSQDSTDEGGSTQGQPSGTATTGPTVDEPTTTGSTPTDIESTASETAGSETAGSDPSGGDSTGSNPTSAEPTGSDPTTPRPTGDPTD